MSLEQAVNELVAKLRERLPEVSIERRVRGRQLEVVFGGCLTAHCNDTSLDRGRPHFEIRFNPLYSLGEWQGDCVIKRRTFQIGGLKLDPVCEKIAAHITAWLAERARVTAQLARAKAELSDATRRIQGATRVERFHDGLFDVRFTGPIEKIEAAILACADDIRARETPTQDPPAADVE